ncbi:MAG: hypothetical protein JXA91_03925 [Candidatus Thermoplasmatota archaeon]|nr:hypothetical protein [Candidatus Thermoplasmatota archaeon]
MWQDTALAIINFCFVLTLIPAILRNFKLKDTNSQSLYTCLPTAILLTIVAFIFITIDLFYSSITTGGTAIAWYILTYQKIKYSTK